jgi:hypothetical protein
MMQPMGILDIRNGTVIFKGFSGMDPFEGVDEGSILNEVVVRTMEGRFAVFNHESGISEPFDLNVDIDAPRLKENGYVHYADMNGDGQKEILLLADDIIGEIYLLDPGEGPEVQHGCIYGYSHPLVTIGSEEGDRVLISSKNSFIWLGSGAGLDGQIVEVLEMDQFNVDIRSNVKSDEDDDAGVEIEDDALPFVIGVGVLLLIVILLVLVLISMKVVKAATGMDRSEE